MPDRVRYIRSTITKRQIFRIFRYDRYSNRGATDLLLQILIIIVFLIWRLLQLIWQFLQWAWPHIWNFLLWFWPYALYILGGLLAIYIAFLLICLAILGIQKLFSGVSLTVSLTSKTIGSKIDLFKRSDHVVSGGINLTTGLVSTVSVGVNWSYGTDGNSFEVTVDNSIISPINIAGINFSFSYKRKNQKWLVIIADKSRLFSIDSFILYKLGEGQFNCELKQSAHGHTLSYINGNFIIWEGTQRLPVGLMHDKVKRLIG